MPDATFARPDLTTFCRLDELGLEALGQRLEPDRAVLACRVVDPDPWCRRCGCEGTARGTVNRRLAHEPFGWRPTTLLVTVRRYRCTGCAHVWRQDTSAAAEPRARLSRRALRWALEGLVIGHLSVARIAEALAVSWNTANDSILAEGRRVLIDDPERFEGVAVIGVDEHVEVEATWGIYQRMIGAYREPDRAKGRQLMAALIESVSHGVPAALSEVITLGRTLKRRAADVLAYFDRPGTSNGPTEAINGRLEHLRGTALGFRNLTNYIARSLLETGGFRPQLHPHLR